MMTPGTAVVNLPEYTHPKLEISTIPVNGLITTLFLESTSKTDQINVPFTFSHAFKIGDILPSDSFRGLQVNVKATHPDGSVRQAIISGVVPSLKAGEILPLPLIRELSSETTSNVSSHSNVLVKLIIAGEEYTACASDELDIWFTGPISTDNLTKYVPFKNAAGVDHPVLTAQFSVRTYLGTDSQRVDVTIEHTKAYKSLTDISYDSFIYVNNTQVYSGSILHYVAARWRKVFWTGSPPELHIKHNSEYMVGTKALANYDTTIKISESTLSGYYNSLNPAPPAVLQFQPMYSGRFQPVFGAPGGRPELGLAPDHYAAFVISGDKRAKDLMLASADVAGSFGTHLRDSDGRMFDIIHWPYATGAGTPADSYNKLTGQREHLGGGVTASKLKPDTSHQPAFAYIPYLYTGDYFYLEELQFWCNWNLYMHNCAYRSYEKGIIQSDQVRGQAWTIRTLAEAAYITPDAHYNKMAFQYWLDNNMEYYRVRYTDGDNNQLGILTNGPAIAYSTKTGIAPWMDDFFTSAIGRCSEMGNKEAGRLLKWKAKFQVGRIMAEGYCWIDASIYSLKVRDTETSPLYTTLKECLQKTLPTEVSSLVCNSQERLAAKNTAGTVRLVLGEMVGYSNSTEGFPSNYQPALAMSVDSGYEGGVKAWEIFNNRSVKPNYSTAPQFAIIPRKSMVSTPVIVIPPEVTPVPDIPPVIILSDVVVSITNPEFINQTGLTVLMNSGGKTKPFLDVAGDVSGTITIKSNWLVSGVKYSCTVIDSNSYTIATIFPIKAT